MYLDNRLSGRRERRLPIAVVVRLKILDDDGAEKHERTYTENLSAHGVRVKSARVWHPGEQAEIIPLNEECPARGEVVYCQKVDDTRFFIGLKFACNRILWRALERYDGISSLSKSHYSVELSFCLWISMKIVDPMLINSG